MTNAIDITRMTDKELSPEVLNELPQEQLLKLIPYGTAEQIGKKIFPKEKTPRNIIYRCWGTQKKHRATVMKATSIFLIDYRNKEIERLKELTESLETETETEENNTEELAGKYAIK